MKSIIVVDFSNDSTDQEKVDCHYCRWGTCETANGKYIACTIEDDGLGWRKIEDSMESAINCGAFEYDGKFPKL